MEDREETEKHPSYGMIAIRHWTGQHDFLFGSSLKSHHQVIAIEITEGERRHSLSEDWFYGGKTIIEVLLSPAQFAELITTPNVGSGVPCTINAMRDGKFKKIEPPPPVHIETEKVRKNFEDKTNELVEYLQKRTDEIEELLLGDKPPKKGDRVAAVNVMRKVIQEVASNMPFVVDQFSRSTERVVTAAKTEIDAFVTAAIHRTGLKGLQNIQAALDAAEENPKLIEGVPPIDREWVTPHMGGCNGRPSRASFPVQEDYGQTPVMRYGPVKCENPQCGYTGGPDDSCKEMP